MTCPVIILACSLVRNKIVSAISSGRINLPSGMSANALLAAIKMVISYEEYERLVQNLNERGI